MRPIVTDVVCSVGPSVCHDREPSKKWLNRSRCPLGCGLGRAQGTTYQYSNKEINNKYETLKIPQQYTLKKVNQLTFIARG